MTQGSDDAGAVLAEHDGAVVTLTLSHPAVLHAMTWALYGELERHLTDLRADDAVRVVVLRGAGEAFAAGTDIRQFAGFSGDEGVAYEVRVDEVIGALAGFPKPVLAAVHGPAVGSGMAMAAACDLRYATPNSRFGVPVSRTLGNCLSLRNYAGLIEAFGEMRTKELLFTGRLFSASEALQAGFLTAIFEEAGFIDAVLDIAHRIAERAPLTLWATKEAIRRLKGTPAVPFDDVVARVYGSQDFAEGVRAHMEKRRPVFEGK